MVNYSNTKLDDQVELIFLTSFVDRGVYMFFSKYIKQKYSGKKIDLELMFCHFHGKKLKWEYVKVERKSKYIKQKYSGKR